MSRESDGPLSFGLNNELVIKQLKKQIWHAITQMQGKKRPPTVVDTELPFDTSNMQLISFFPSYWKHVSGANGQS